jgi:3-hydroxymyristoyl/3-hydroxydecanoyl-(acyl carrier protein) dehydratase
VGATVGGGVRGGVREVGWGSAIVERLIPHRAPFRMIDHIEAIALPVPAPAAGDPVDGALGEGRGVERRDERSAPFDGAGGARAGERDVVREPMLRARRWIDPADPVLAGHFPDAPVFPGALIMEALAQTAAALGACVAIGWEGVAALEAGAAGGGADLGAAAAAMRDAELRGGGAAGVTVGAGRVLGSVNLRFVAPVLPGVQLHCTAWLVRTLGDARSFRVEASVAGEIVAVGTVSSTGR